MFHCVSGIIRVQSTNVPVSPRKLVTPKEECPSREELGTHQNPRVVSRTVDLASNRNQKLRYETQ